MTDENFLIVVDGHALIYRAYHAFPKHLTSKEGVLVNAVYGFSRIVLKVIRDFDPKYLAITFDTPHKTIRSESYAEYKATRAEMPDDLKTQIPLIKDIVTTFNWPQFELPGYEADDIIGTFSRQLPDVIDEEPSLEMMIVTGDKDLLQLVTDRVEVLMPARGEHGQEVIYTPEEVKERLGITPRQVIDLKSLMGDASDNIPGVKGIGKKTATALIQSFESLEKIYERVAELESDSTLKDPLIKGAVFTKLLAGKDSAFMSYQLATINTEVPLSLDLEACKVSGYEKQKAIEMLEELGFKSLIGLLPADDFELGLQSALF